MHNGCVKKALALRDAKGRASAGMTIIDGEREVRRALEAGFFLDKVFYVESVPQDLWTMLTSKGIVSISVTPAVMEKLVYGKRYEGILAVAKTPTRGFKDLTLSAAPRVVVLESLEKPGNLGAVLRTCDAVGVEAVFVCDPKTDVYNPNVIRSSTGAVFSVPVVCADGKAVFSFLKSKKINICAAAPGASCLYSQVNLKGALALVLGREDKGLSDYWLKAADMTIRIPMLNVVDSLNVSVSAAVVLYEALRQQSAV